MGKAYLCILNLRNWDKYSTKIVIFNTQPLSTVGHIWEIGKRNKVVNKIVINMSRSDFCPIVIKLDIHVGLVKIHIEFVD